jgi:adenylate kinase family enzyme
MQRILVIGSPGAGKSTLARRLGERLGLPLVHLDREHWSAGWVSLPKDEFVAKVAELAARPSWIIDGNYASTLDVRAARATAIIWLDLPRWLCMARIFKRIIVYRGRVRPDMAGGCPERLSLEFLRYAWNFSSHSRPGNEALVTAARDDQKVVVLRTPGEVARFLNQGLQHVPAAAA